MIDSELMTAIEGLDASIELQSKKLLKKESSFSYRIKDKIIATVSFYDYDIENFDWILIANVYTKKKYRRNGLSSDLIQLIYKEIAVPKRKGLYAFVDIKNESAIKLYKSNGFSILKTFENDNRKFYIMIKGNQNKRQFDNMNFNVD